MNSRQIQYNNKRVLKRLHNLIKDMKKSVSIKVGILQKDGSKKVDGADITMADLGAVHEFGTTISTTSKMRGWFYNTHNIHKSSAAIVIPTRSFLRMPLMSEEGQKALRKALNDQLSNDREFNLLVQNYDEKAKRNSTLLDAVAVTLGAEAVKRVEEAFNTGGFGNWAEITEFTKENRKGDKSAPPLTDTGQLRHSISYEVKYD